MVCFVTTLVTTLVGLAAVTAGHPGHDIKAEAAERAAFLQHAPAHSRSLSHCSAKLKARGHEGQNVARREATVQKLRRRRSLKTDAHYLKARDLDSALNTTHHSDLDVNPSTDPSVLFGSEATCILGPDVTQGPYYVSGEMIRKNLVESQEGVPLFMDIQLINTNTCEPLPRIYMGLWHCNATGVYSGVVANGNGDTSDESNLDSTFLRGLQKSDQNGVIQFESIFPGHYTGRATHIHVMTHPANETKALPNGTITGLYTSHSSHVGQLFFDQDLISAVEETSPYSSNTQETTLNADDSILQQEAETIDPFMECVYLGEDITDGLFAWISVGVDPREDNEVTPSAYYTEEGGVENEDAGMGMGGGGGPPPGASSMSGMMMPSASPSRRG